MEFIILYVLSHIFVGVFSGFMGMYFNLASRKRKFTPFALFIVITYLFYVAVILGLAQTIWWITQNAFIPDAYKGVSTILLLLFVYPGVLLAKKLLGPSKNLPKPA